MANLDHNSGLYNCDLRGRSNGCDEEMHARTGSGALALGTVFSALGPYTATGSACGIRRYRGRRSPPFPNPRPFMPTPIWTVPIRYTTSSRSWTGQQRSALGYVSLMARIRSLFWRRFTPIATSTRFRRRGHFVTKRTQPRRTWGPWAVLARFWRTAAGPAPMRTTAFRKDTPDCVLPFSEG